MPNENQVKNIKHKKDVEGIVKKLMPKYELYEEINRNINNFYIYLDKVAIHTFYFPKLFIYINYII